MQLHCVQGHLGLGPGNAEAAQRAQPSVREARGVAADRVALDDDARHARLRQVVGSGHAREAAAQDHNISRAFSHCPEILSKSMRLVNPSRRDVRDEDCANSTRRWPRRYRKSLSGPRFSRLRWRYEGAGRKAPDHRVANRLIRARFRARESVAACRLGTGWSKNFIVASEEPKGPNQSAPLVFTTRVVAGAGFEPATFGL